MPTTAERYWRLYGVSHSGALASRHHEHERLLEAVVAGDQDGAARLMGEHLAGTARSVLGDFDADFAPQAISCAVDLVTPHPRRETPTPLTEARGVGARASGVDGSPVVEDPVVADQSVLSQGVSWSSRR